jgi:hypothetical protein
MLNEQQVDYFDDITIFAREYRRIHREYEVFGELGARNVAVFVYEDGYGKKRYMTQMSESGEGIGYVKHSEEVLMECYEAEVGSNGKILWVYTELRCCGSGRGMKQCRYKIEPFLKEYGKNREDTPVYYSFCYPEGDTERAREARRECVSRMRQTVAQLRWR